MGVLHCPSTAIRLTGRDVESRDDIFGNVVQVLHQGTKRVAVSSDLPNRQTGHRQKHGEVEF